MKNTKLKKILVVVLSVVLFIFVLREILVVLEPKTEHGVRQARCLYAQPRDTIDVCFMGSSHAHCNINTKILWDDYGIAAYDYSAAEQPLWITYYYLYELLKNQKPRLIVLDMYAPARFEEDYQYRWLPDNLNGIRFSRNKYEMAKVSCEAEVLNDYFPSFFNFHTRYDEIGMEDIKELFKTDDERKAFKGYTPYYYVAPLEKPDFDVNGYKEISDKSKIYLNKIIELVEENEIELSFIVTPYYVTSEDEAVYNFLKDYCENKGYPFCDYNREYDEIGLDFSKDFNDYSHLNYDGGIKFTKYLAEEIKGEYDIPDRRGLKEWESWERQVY